MKNVRILPGVRVDAWVVDDELTLTKNWATVANTVADDLVGLTYQGDPLVEVVDAEADDAEEEASPAAWEAGEDLGDLEAETE